MKGISASYEKPSDPDIGLSEKHYIKESTSLFSEIERKLKFMK